MKVRCRHPHVLTVVPSPAPGILAIRWCPKCGALYNHRYSFRTHWSKSRVWQPPGGRDAMAYVRLRKSARLKGRMARKP